MPTRRFRSTVPYYRRYRPRYPATLIEAVARAVGLGRSDRVLDLGAGPGFLAIGFAQFAGESIAMDPEPAMLAAAREEAAKAGARLGFVLGGSQDLGPHLGRFRLVVMGRSFHWMEPDATLGALDRLIGSAGAIALFGEAKPKDGAPGWRDAWRAVLDRWTAQLEPGRKAAREQEAHEASLARSAFAQMERLTVDERRQSRIEDMIGRALSMSSTSPERLGDQRVAFEADLRHTLAPFARDGVVEEHLIFEALVARRPG